MKTQWFPKEIRNDREAKEKYAKSIKQAEKVLSRLADIIQEQIDALDRPEANYADPGWALQQADHNGKLVAYHRVLSLLNTKGPTTNA